MHVFDVLQEGLSYQTGLGNRLCLLAITVHCKLFSTIRLIIVSLLTALVDQTIDVSY